MKKNGFISMAVVYTFIIVFLLVILSLLTAYSYRVRVLSMEADEVKEFLNKEYQE